jgi:hypothetical protein
MFQVLNNLKSLNSFSLLDVDDICARATEMGVNLDTFTLDKINNITDLDVARHNLNCKTHMKKLENLEEQPAISNQVLFLSFGGDEEEVDDFTPVISRKTKKKMKSACKIQRFLERNRQNAKSKGAQSRSVGTIGRFPA